MARRPNDVSPNGGNKPPLTFAYAGCNSYASARKRIHLDFTTGIVFAHLRKK
jgi:hypothetical protein